MSAINGGRYGISTVGRRDGHRLYRLTLDERIPGGGDFLECEITGPDDIDDAFEKFVFIVSETTWSNSFGDSGGWPSRKTLLPWRVVSDVNPLPALTVEQVIRARGGAGGTYRRMPGEPFPP